MAEWSFEKPAPTLHGGRTAAVGAAASPLPRLLTSGFTPLAFASNEQADDVFGKIAEVINQGDDDPNDEPDTQENPMVPAGYTYLGQFIDHDLTFDTISNLTAASPGPDNHRTPRLDLDCLYGLGPDDQPYMYDGDGGLLLAPGGQDLLRSANGRAIIGDPRNDENSIVCQLQMAFIRLHNALVQIFINRGDKLPFEAARREVRRTYQRVIIDDYLKRIIDKNVWTDFLGGKTAPVEGDFKLFTPDKRKAIPVEFSGAAYRYGHSMIRNAYRLNAQFQRRIFDGSNNNDLSLVGFGPLPPQHLIDWTLFVPNPKTQAPGDANTAEVFGKDRLQFAYKIDTTMVDPLMKLPLSIAGPVGAPFRSLAARNLKRGYLFGLPSGQDVAKALGVKCLEGDELKFGPHIAAANGKPARPRQGFDEMGLDKAVAAQLNEATPLWLYCLAEAVAQAKIINEEPEFSQAVQLGPVGGRILLEVFYGLLLEDTDSCLYAPQGWQPLVGEAVSGTVTLWDVLAFTGEV